MWYGILEPTIGKESEMFWLVQFGGFAKSCTKSGEISELANKWNYWYRSTSISTRMMKHCVDIVKIVWVINYHHAAPHFCVGHYITVLYIDFLTLSNKNNEFCWYKFATTCVGFIDVLLLSFYLFTFTHRPTLRLKLLKVLSLKLLIFSSIAILSSIVRQFYVGNQLAIRKIHS